MMDVGYTIPKNPKGVIFKTPKKKGVVEDDEPNNTRSGTIRNLYFKTWD